MELDARKKTILTAIIQTYLETGEPVGSRTISKYTDLNLSSATIRNEMSDLEEMGYILQPHTSAGRIPSDKGYRLYVDELIRQKDQEVSDIKELMIEKTDRLEKVLKQVVKVLASNTNYATMITGPAYHQNRLKFIQLSRVNEEQVLAVIVAEGNLVKNQIIDLEELACELILRLEQVAPGALQARYKVDQVDVAQPYECLEALARSRGFLQARGQCDTERMARVLLDEFRSGKLGRITLQPPPEEPL